MESITSEPTTTTRPNPRKKTNSKQDDVEKITEKVEGGIIVRRYKGKKIEIE
jgi:hypothetical protein